MKTMLLVSLKSPLQLSDLNKPAPTKNQSIIKLFHAGLNRRDYWIRQGQYPKINLPVVLGSDGLGTLETNGKRVFFNPGIGWGNQEQFQDKDFHITGMPDQGTLSEYISITDTRIYDVPDHLSDPEGACLPLAGLTAYRGLFVQGNLQRGQKILITGTGGGVATLAIKMALAGGARVFTNSSSREKINKAMDWGCENGWNYKANSDWAQKAKKDAGGFDLILDGSGGDTVQDYVNLLNPGGRLVTYGATLGAWKNVPAAKVFWKQLHLIGTTMGSDQDFEDMLGFVTRHEIRPHVDRVFDLDETNEAFEYLNSPEAFGKIVIKINAT